jgi:hypothetical protein
LSPALRSNAGMANSGTSTCASRNCPAPVRTLAWLGWLGKGRLLVPHERGVCGTEQKLEPNSRSVAGAAGKGRYVGVPTL